MGLRKKLAVVCLAAPFLAGFAEAELKEVPKERPNMHIVDEAVARGAASCRYNLELMVLLTIGDRDWDGFATYPIGAEASRPSTGIYVTKYPDGGESHLQWVAGPDGSGYCTVYWTETRYWKQSCTEVVGRYEGKSWMKPQSMGTNTLIQGIQEKGNGVRVVATQVSDRCLVTESEMAWRIDPDGAARDWIKSEKGYDPDAPRGSKE